MLALSRIGHDPRIYQITLLTLLLAYGAIVLGFDISAAQMAASLGTALGVQWLFTRALGLPRFDPKSPLISGLSLCLILRTNDPLLAGAAAAVAIGSKFLVRHRGKHVFNPTNAALAVMLVATDRAWVSPGQWGSAVFVAFLFACLGGLVVNRAARSDVTYAFLAFFSLIVVGRSLWLGDPLAIPIHRLQSGTLLLFAFFMISDPKTTPNRRAGRVLFAFLTAVTGAIAIFSLHEPNGLLYALVLTAPGVPVIDRLLPGRAYDWTRVRSVPSKGDAYVPLIRSLAAGARARRAAAGDGVLRLLRSKGRRPALQ